jgi:uncharacterized protein
MNRARVVKLLLDHLVEIQALDVSELSLFGSVARDEAVPGSDVDILVEFTGRPTWRGYMTLKLLLEALLEAPVDLATPRMIRPEVADSVRRDLVRVA